MVESLRFYRESTTDRRCVALQRSEHVKGPLREKVLLVIVGKS